VTDTSLKYIDHWVRSITSGGRV